MNIFRRVGSLIGQAVQAINPFRQRQRAIPEQEPSRREIPEIPVRQRQRAPPEIPAEPEHTEHWHNYTFRSNSKQQAIEYIEQFLSTIGRDRFVWISVLAIQTEDGSDPLAEFAPQWSTAIEPSQISVAVRRSRSNVTYAMYTDIHQVSMRVHRTMRG